MPLKIHASFLQGILSEFEHGYFSHVQCFVSVRFGMHIISSRDIPMAKSEDEMIEVKVLAGMCFEVESRVFSETPTM